MRIAEVVTWLDEDSGATLQEVRPVESVLAPASPPSDPKSEARRFVGQGRAEKRYPEGTVTLTYGFSVEAATVEEAFAGAEQAEVAAREAAIKEFETKRTKAVLSGRIALPRSGINRLTLPPGNGG